MSFRLDLPPFFRDMNDAYSYLTRTVNNLNYALSFLDVPEATAGAEIRAEDVNNKSIKISDKSTNTQYPTSKAVYDYAVPQGRKVNDKALSADITLDAGDVGAVPDTRKVNDKRLNADITLIPGDLGEADYVTETGSNADGWSWRKWASGKLELWAQLLDVTPGTWSGYATNLATANVSITLPVAFYDLNFTCVAAISRGASGGAAAGVFTIRHSAVDTLLITLLCGASVTATVYKMDLYLSGRWK